MENLEKVATLLKNSKKTVILTGAGMSTESGIPDFRSSRGLYSRVPEEMLSRSFFDRHPLEFYDFFSQNFIFDKFQPNKGHEILAKWEKEGLISRVITQNIDSLHTKVGSTNVLEMHGNVDVGICQNYNCKKSYTQREYLSMKDSNYRCECGYLIKPDIVLYEEAVPKMNEAVREVESCDLFIVLGTSMIVYPVASLIEYLKKDANIVIINYSKTPYDQKKNVINIKEGIGDTLEKIDALI